MISTWISCRAIDQLKDKKQRMNSRLLNTFLDAPIVRTRRDNTYLLLVKALKNLSAKGLTREQLRIYQFLVDSRVSHQQLTVLDPSDYPAIWNCKEWETKTIPTDTFLRYYYLLNKEACDSIGPNVSRVLLETLDATAQQYYTKAAAITKAIVAAQQNEFGGGLVFVPINKYHEAWCHPNICLVRRRNCPDATVYLASYEQMLCIKDVMLMRGNIFEAADTTTLKAAVKRFLRYQENCLRYYGNKGYEVLKSCEPLTKTFLIERTDEAFSGVGGTWHNQFIKACTKEKELRKDGLYPANEELRKLLEDCSTDIIVELFGLQKLSGHPLIDPAEGGLSAAKEARDPGLVTPKAAQDLRNSWCKIYLQGFVRQHRRWPQLHFTRKDTQLYRLYISRRMPLTKEAYSKADWTGTYFYQHHDMDMFPDFLDMVDDKSLSFSRSKWASSWSRAVRPDSERRLLLELLRQPELSIEHIVKTIQESGFDYDDTIISLYPKEREFKLKARMFAILRLKPRLFLGTLEANIADKLFPCFESQTMTADRDQVIKRFFDVTSVSKDRLYIEIDLSRWNLRWRKEAQYLIGKDMEDIFGAPRTFTRVHEFFESCMMMVRHPDSVPEDLHLSHPRTQPLIWYNHCGGCEGLFQKGWTSMTYAMVEIGMERFSRSYSLTGQGDNQVLTVPLSAAEQESPSLKRKLAQNILDSIEEASLKVNQIAKPEECLASTTLLTYSKDIFLKGSLIHLNLKNASRILPRATEDFAAIGSAVSGAGSSGEGAASKSSSPERMLKIALIQSYHFFYGLDEQWIGQQLRSVTVSNMCDRLKHPLDVARILSSPPPLGGFFPSCLSFFVRGTADPAARDLGALWMARNRSSFASGMLIRCLEGQVMPPFERLISDPYALPVDLLPSGASAVQKRLLPVVLGVAKNQDILEVLKADLRGGKAKLINFMQESDPFNPLVMRDLYANSVFGAAEEIKKLFVSSRTASGLAAKARASDDIEDSVSITATSLVAEASALYHLVSSIDSAVLGGRREIHSGTLMEFAKRSRARWGVNMQGVEGWFMLDSSVIWDNAEAVGVSLIFPDPVTIESTRNRGNYRPYFGYKTGTKRHVYGYKISTTGKPEKSLADLASIASMTRHSGFRSLVRAVSVSRGVDITQYAELISSRVGGTASHRYQSSAKDRTSSANGIETLSTWAILDSDHAGYLTASADDYPYMFQEAAAYLLAMTLQRVKEGHSVSRVTITAPEKMEPIIETELQAPAETPVLPEVMSRLVRVEKLVLTATAGRLVTQGVVDVSPGSLSPRFLLTAVFTRYLLGAPVVFDTGLVLGTKRLPLDLLELKCSSDQLILHAAGEACAVCATLNVGLRWSDKSVLSLRIQNMARQLSSELMTYSAISSRLLSFIGRSGNKTMVYERGPDALATNIAKRAYNRVREGGNLVPLLCTVITSDDEPSMVLSIIVLTLSCITVSSANLGASRRSIARSIERTRWIEQQSDADIGGIMRETELNLALWRSDDEDEVIRRVTSDACDRVLFRRVLVPEAELVRELRSQQPPTASQDARIEKYREIPLGRLTQNLQRASPLQSEYVHNLVRGESTSLAQWVSMAHHVRGQYIMHVGVGFGASAVALLWRDSRRVVFGLDLSHHLARHTLLVRERVPVLLAGSGLEGRYMTHPRQWDTSGDVTNPSIIKRVVEGLPENTAWVIDFVRTEQEFVRLHTSIQTANALDLVYIRVPISLVKDTSVSWYVMSRAYSIVCVYTRGGHREDALLLSTKLTRANVIAGGGILVLPNTLTPRSILYRNGGLKSEIEDYASGVIEFLPKMTIREILSLSYTELRDSIDRRRYDSHTILLCLAMVHKIVESDTPLTDSIRYSAGVPFDSDPILQVINEVSMRKYFADIIAPKVLAVIELGLDN